MAMRNRVIASFLLLGPALVLTGCGVNEYVAAENWNVQTDVPYQSSGNAAPVAGASAATVSVVALDGRTTHRDRVGTRRDMLGFEMGVIVATNDIPQTVGRAFEQELRTQGFQIGSGRAAISVEVLRFYDDFPIGVFGWSVAAGVRLNVAVRDPASSMVFTKTYDGVGNGADSSYARAALIKAFQSAVNSAVNDKALQAALFAAQPPRTAGATISPSS